MAAPEEAVSSADVWLWWVAFVMTAGVIPFVVVAYLYHPARTRLENVREVARRTEAALEEAPHVRGKLQQYRERMD